MFRVKTHLTFVAFLTIFDTGFCSSMCCVLVIFWEMYWSYTRNNSYSENTKTVN